MIPRSMSKLADDLIQLRLSVEGYNQKYNYFQKLPQHQIVIVFEIDSNQYK